MKVLVIFSVIYIFLALVSDYYLKKKLQIDRKKTQLPKKAKVLQTLFLSIVFVLYIAAAIYIIFIPDKNNILLIVVPFLIVVALIRGVFQRIYNRQAKIWILEYNQAIWYVVLFIVVYYIYPVIMG
ncbi:DUF4181 domain-containing protein [Sporosarcina ureilytica]|uniref:DUF4181 domain-containing protein n=1 Tax=Sporosarcina ureilytica TaxID=298596 RepID=A0A1D8JBW3_9BACL|nr:DUF4181 domain-containing protein [Sporosarcina ureilytica]AOV06190.1 hypothetical protein BI350_00080 [Sporosarcina ureilytica]